MRAAERRLVVTLGIVLFASGCGYLQNRLKTCEDTSVDLINDEQTLGPIHLLGPEEAPSAQTLLQSGQARRITQCLDKGDVKRFRAQQPNETTPVATANCAASLASYETARPRVRWTPIGLRCESW